MVLFPYNLYLGVNETIKSRSNGKAIKKRTTCQTIRIKGISQENINKKKYHT
jgi:hypothetical protein